VTDFQLSPENHHYLGIEMNQQVWKLLDQTERDERANQRMEQFALASLYHWQRSPNYKPLNAQRGHWLLSRVYAVLERGEEALTHGKRCMSLSVELDLKDFDLAYAHEAMARAYAATKNTDEATAHYVKASQAGATIADEKAKKIFGGDLEGPPWFGLAL
jgi:hypothetical protein